MTILAGINFRFLFYESIFSYQKLYRYQLKKIQINQINTSSEILFVGDSSLGNAVDANLFTKLSHRKTLNLALTGSYGYAGSFNMVRRALQDLKIHQVFVVHTLDILQRPTSYEGYLYTMLYPNDISHLTTGEVFNLGNSFLNIIFSGSNLEKIWNSYQSKNVSDSIREDLKANDYVVQNSKKKASLHLDPIQGSLNKDEFRFLVKLNNLCKKSKVKLIYVHGPIAMVVRQSSQSYIQEVNQELAKRGISYIPDVIEIKPQNLGDEIDHVAPKAKPIYTHRYFQLLKSYL